MKDRDLGDTTETTHEVGASRRTIVKGAAWSVPVIAVAVGLPEVVASVCVPGTFTATAPVPGNPAAATSVFEVPAGVTSLTFQVAGGAGGTATYWAHSPVGRGGEGARVDGVLSVTPGQFLTLVVGQGGAGALNTAGDEGGPTGNAPGHPGGGGYGNGGDTTWTGGPNSFYDSFAGGSGGGGSAILLGATPLVVAGGGGGSGAWNGKNIPTSPGIGRPPQSGGSGGLAGSGAGANGNDSQFVAPGLFAPSWTVYGGQGAVGSTPGAGGSPGTTGSTGLVLPGIAATGTNGAPGVSAAFNQRTLVSGAGGGGYAGGGSGGRTNSTGIPSGSSWLMAGAAGGAGSSFLSTLAEGTFAQAGNSPAEPLVRNPGWITLSWTC